jgi:hypothetical protein
MEKHDKVIDHQKFYLLMRLPVNSHKRKKNKFALEDRRDAAHPAAESRERRRDVSSAFQSPTLPSRADLAKLPLDLCSRVPDTSFSSSWKKRKKKSLLTSFWLAIKMM